MTSAYYIQQDYSLGELIELVAELTGQPEEDFQECSYWEALEQINNATDY